MLAKTKSKAFNLLGLGYTAFPMKKNVVSSHPIPKLGIPYGPSYADRDAKTIREL